MALRKLRDEAIFGLGLVWKLVHMTRLATPDAIRLLREHIDNGKHGPEARLEPERVLARRLGCSRTTLRAALDALERERLLWRHVGQGTFLGERPRAEPIRERMLMDSITPKEMLEARLVIEPAIAAAAALHSTESDDHTLGQLAMKTSRAATWQEYERFDSSFHFQVAKAAGNPLLVSFLVTLASVRIRVKWQRRHGEAFRRAGRTEYSARQGDMHMAIADAIAMRDPLAAQAAMLEHLRVVHGLMLSLETEAAGQGD